MKEAWERFENSPAAGLVVVVLWCAMIMAAMWVATAFEHNPAFTVAQACRWLAAQEVAA